MSLARSLATRLLLAHPGEAAAELEALSDRDALQLLTGSPPAVVAEVLARLAPLRAARILGQLDDHLAREAVAHLGLDRSTELIRRMESDPRSRILDALEPDRARQLETLLEFPEGSAGSLMDPQVLALPLDVTAAAAIDHVRKEPQNIRYNLYVLDRERRLVGVLTLRELLLADPDATLASIARREVMSIQGHEGRSAILAHPAWRESHSLPVVDRRGVYLGTIRYRTWRRLEEESARARGGVESPTADALGDLFSTGMEGLIGALTNIAARPIAGGTVGDE